MNGFLVISEIKLWFLSFLHFTRGNEKISFKNLCQGNETRKMQFFLLAIHGFNHELPTVQRAVSFFCFPSPTPTKGNNAPEESGRIPPSPVPTRFALRASTMTLIELESITKNKHPVSFIKLDKPEIQHFVPVATRVFFLGKQIVPTLGPSCTGLTSLINAISFLRWDMEKPACMIILLTRYTTPSPWIRCAPIEWFRIRNKK